MSFTKKPSTETLSATTTGMAHSNSFQDIFSSENSEQARDIIMNNVRNEITRRHSQTNSETGSDDYVLNKIDPIDTTVTKSDKNKRKPTMLLAGPRFRSHTVQPENNLKRNTIYPISVCIKSSYNLFLYLLF